jgi:hypothetical protein
MQIRRRRYAQAAAGGSLIFVRLRGVKRAKTREKPLDLRQLENRAPGEENRRNYYTGIVAAAPDARYFISAAREDFPSFCFVLKRGNV